jgi:hypothetical protein
MKTKAAYSTLTLVIDQMVADTLDRNTIESLRNMLDLPAFQPIRNVIEKKIIEVGNFLKAKDEAPKPEPIQVWMGANQEKKVESNDALREEIEDLLISPPFEYENEQDIRDHFGCLMDNYKDSLEFDIVLDAPVEKT